MRLFTLLIFTALSFFQSLSSPGYQFQECDSIKTEVQTKKPNGNDKDGEITIIASGGQGKLHYFFFNEKGRPLNSTKEEVNNIKGLSSGTYKCSVVDEAGCIKKLVIELI